MSETQQRLREGRPHVVVVEGDDEYHFLVHLLTIRHDLQSICLWNATGRNNFRAALREITDHPLFAGIRSLSMILDAEENRDAANDLARNAISSAGLIAPTQEGNFTDETPATGYLILPDAGSGCFEDVCLKGAAAKVPMECVENLIDCFQQNGMPPFYPAKAKVHAILGMTDKPGLIGKSVHAGIWDLTKPPFVRLLNFLTSGTAF